MQCSANVKTALHLRVSAVFYTKLAALAHHAAFIQQQAALIV